MGQLQDRNVAFYCEYSMFLVCTLLIFCDIFISFYLLMMQYSYETYVRNKILLLLEIGDI